MFNVYLFISFFLGIVAGWKLAPSSLVPAVIVVVVLLFLYVVHKRTAIRLFRSFLVFLFFALGMLWVMPYTIHAPADVAGKRAFFLITAASEPKAALTRQNYTAYIRRINGNPAYQRVYVNDFSDIQMHYRDTYLIEGKLSRSKNRNFYVLWIKRDSYREKLPSSLLSKGIVRLHQKILFYFDTYLAPPSNGLLSSVVLGRREFISKDMKRMFSDAGVAHLLAISGLHVGLVVLLLFFILGLVRIPFKKRLIISIVFVFLYAYAAGLRASTLRAAIMYAVFASSFLLRRRVHIISAYGFAGLLCLFIQPLWAFDIGFQLSFLSVGGIVAGFRLCAPRLLNLRGPFLYIKGIFLTTLFVTVSITPLVSLYFGRIHLIGIIANLILIPLFSLILFATLVLLLIASIAPLAVCIGASVSFLAALFMRIVLFLSSFGFSSLSFRCTPAAACVYYIFLMLFFIGIQQRIRRMKAVTQ